MDVEQLGSALLEIQRLEAERDAALRERDEANERSMFRAKQVDRLGHERDEANEQLKRLDWQLARLGREMDAALEDAKTNADAAVWSLRERDAARAYARSLEQEVAGAERERDEAREVARDFWPDLGHMSDYLFKKHYSDYTERYPWLVEAPNDPTP